MNFLIAGIESAELYLTVVPFAAAYLDQAEPISDAQEQQAAERHEPQVERPDRKHDPVLPASEPLARGRSGHAQDEREQKATRAPVPPDMEQRADQQCIDDSECVG